MTVWWSKAILIGGVIAAVCLPLGALGTKFGIWQFTGGKTLTNHWENLADLPASSPESDNMSRELKKRGFKFVGTTICYAFMQAAGMVNDHMVYCTRYHQVGTKE